MNPSVQLQAIELKTSLGNCQTLAIDLVQPGELIQPAALADLPLPELDWSRGVVLYGQVPVWLYAHLVDRCRRAAWLGIYSIQLRAAVVVHSAVAAPQVGDRIALYANPVPGAAILIGGPPDSGKSVLSNLLRRNVAQRSPHRVYLHRANWDGEGNWAYETSDRQQVRLLVKRYDADLHRHPDADRLLPQYFRAHAKSIENIRSVVDLTLVDVGGMPQPEKLPVVEQCSHYIVISRSPERVQEWHDLCQPHLQPIAILHSQPSAEPQLLDSAPLTLRLGIQQLLEHQSLPDALLNRVLELCDRRSP